jgi:alpha-tubulin suppressor-like RCC1 family protein
VNLTKGGVDMRKRWFNFFMGIFILLFAGLWIAGCTDMTGLDGMKDKHNHDGAEETDVVAVAGGDTHTIELRSDGTVWAWGSNQYGQLGDGTTIDSPALIQVSGLTDVTAIAAGDYHTVAIKTDGTVWAWGRNNVGQLGNGTTTDSPVPIEVSDLTDVIAVSAGKYHTIALKTDGTAWTWGGNGSYQLGAETTETCQEWYLIMGEFHSRYNPCSTTPVQISGLTDVTAIATKWLHNIAVKADGTVWVWGSNKYGQFGDETRTSSTTPVQVSGLTDVTAIAAGSLHSIAVKADGTVWAWGWNNFGQLGDGATWNYSTTLVQVSGLTDVTAIAAGGSHSIAVKADGTVWAWGSNEHGQLGVTMTEICEITVSLGDKGGYTYPAFCSTIPVQVSSLTDVTAIAAGGSYSIAVTDGTAWAWGDNEYGQLGAVTTETCGYEDEFDCSSTPVPVRSKASGTFSVGGTVSGLTGTVVLQDNGGDDLTIMADGPFSFDTELTDLDIYDITVLTQPFNQTCNVTSGRINAADVTDIRITCFDLFMNVAAVAAGSTHTVMLKTDGTVWAWGYNKYGQLGDGTTTDSTTPMQVSGLTDVTAIAAGSLHTIALKTDGTVWTWGANSNGQLGDGTMTGSSTPVQVSGLTDVTGIAAGKAHTLALKTDGTVWAWGYNGAGNLGDGTTTGSTMPVQVSGLTDVAGIAAGGEHTIVVKTDGTVWTWGWNFYGQLGAETTETCYSVTTPCSSTPVQVSGLTDVTAVAAGQYHSIALKTDGTVWAWGYNKYGQLGDGTTTDSTTPVQISGLTDVTAIAAGSLHTIALKPDGTVWAWGANSAGKLGDGTTTDSATPVQVSGLTDVAGIAAGGEHTIVVKTDGTVWTWGWNFYGQLGDTTTTDRYTPVPVLVTP